MTWLLNLLFRRIDVGGSEDPYMVRWHLIPRNKWMNVYLHQFLRDDDDRALHDHPWWFVSFLIWGRYDELLSDDGSKVIYRNAPSIAYRPAEFKHRVVLPRIITGVDFDGSSVGVVREIRKPAWTIIITGPKRRTWGFWCPKGFVPWFRFVELRGGEDTGKVGRGCGD